MENDKIWLLQKELDKARNEITSLNSRCSHIIRERDSLKRKLEGAYRTILDNEKRLSHFMKGTK